MPNSSMNRQSTGAIAEIPAQNSPLNLTGPSDTALAFLALVIPVVVCCTVFAHRRYRTVILRQRVKKLEKVWELPAARRKTTSWE